MLRASLRSVISTALLVSFAQPSAAQTVRGVVTDSLGGGPIASAVVQLLTAEGYLSARSITNASGAFVVRATTPATQLRVVRIGYRPRTQAITLTPGVEQRIDLRMLRVQAFLDPVRVLAAQCRRRGRESPAGLIEQARAGLLSTIVSREANPAAMRRLVFERAYSPTSDSILRILVHLDSSDRDTRSFSTVRDAAGFVEQGFFDGAARRFLGPDAEVLLDDRFAAGYCFRVMPASRARPNQVGLGFEPAGSKRGRVDIEGALWIDTLARELRDLEFRYVGLDATLTQYGPGGYSAFRSMANGMVVLDRWSLYLVGTIADTVSDSRAGRSVATVNVFRWESGGQLLDAAWTDGTRWHASLGVIRGVARSPDGQPAAGVTLVLAGSPYRAVTDSLGRFTVSDVLPGPYPVHAVEPKLATLGISLPTAAQVFSALDTVSIGVSVPTAQSIAVEACPPEELAGPYAHGVFVLARALTSEGQPVQNADWVLRAHHTESWSEIAGQGKTDRDGLIAVCSRLQRGWPVDLKLVVPGSDTVTVSRVLTETVNLIPVLAPTPRRR